MENNHDYVKKGIAQKVAKAVRTYVEPSPISPLGWPPVSMGLYYQPKRPTELRVDANQKEEVE